MVLNLWSKNTLGFYALVAHFFEEDVGITVHLCPYTTDNGSNMVKSFEKLIIEGILEPGGMSDSEENVDDLDLNIKRIHFKKNLK